MFERNPIRPVRLKENKCKITVNRKKDGSIVKELSGECTPAQLKALGMNKDFDISIDD